jgi:hypothetical protein
MDADGLSGAEGEQDLPDHCHEPDDDEGLRRQSMSLQR